MRAPLAWLGEFVELPAGLAPRTLAEALLQLGLEVEQVGSAADGMSGPIIVGRVLSLTDEPQRNGKIIRWCQVDVGEPAPRGIVCGAHNFQTGDLVVTALPGAVLPGGFEIAARKTYGHLSDGMICSARELGLGEDHTGILVLDPESLDPDSLGSDPVRPGGDAVELLGLREVVLDLAITPDRGYCLSMRGLAREAAAGLDVAFHDLELTLPAADGQAYPVLVADPDGCDLFCARAVAGLNPAAPTPPQMARRLREAGMRPISLAVDIANYVMLETGQPLHTFDRAKLSGPIGVRRARAGEVVVTLDGVTRDLVADDLVVTDDSGPIALAGVMGGQSTQIDASTTDIVLEAAHWDPPSVSRAVRRHKLPSEAGKRFERGVDPGIAGIALQRCVDLLVAHGGARAVDGYTVVGDPRRTPAIPLPSGLPAAIAGMPIGRDAVIARLERVGCAVRTIDRTETAGSPAAEEILSVAPPTWRPDLNDPADLVEEVVRLEGYQRIPSQLPTPPPGRGLTETQLLRRRTSRNLACAGFTEVLSSPFLSPSVHDALGIGPDDPRRRALRLANPLSETEPELRTSLLPGLLATLARNVGRGIRDVALFEMGLVFCPAAQRTPAPRLATSHAPSHEELDALQAALPAQPRHAAIVATGQLDRHGWWGPGRPTDWSDAIEAARVIADTARAQLRVERGALMPWHPGRCAALYLDANPIGHAGELHPRVIAALALPERTVAMELDLDAFAAPAPPRAAEISTFPPVFLDVALVVPSTVPAADVSAALRDGAGELLEALGLFDVYLDEQRLGAGHRSLAFALTLRAADRTLTVEEATEARDAAVAMAAQRCGAVLRS